MMRSVGTIVTKVIAIGWSAFGISVPSRAGGDSREFVIQELTRQADGNVMIQLLQTRTEGDEYRHACESLTISIADELEFPWWKRRCGAESPVSRQDHALAIRALEAAFQESRPIRFGSMGEGLYAKKDEPCKARSRGIKVIQEIDGHTAIYSYYKVP